MENAPRPGRPGLNYEDVANAANELAAAGEKPTCRKLRSKLGTGSMGAIQRHLATWRASRPRIKASSPFAISPSDVENLDPVDFAALINHLVRFEVQRNGLVTVPDTTLRINDPDGGVDGAVVWSGGPDRTAVLPARDNVWQAKSGRRVNATELLREIQLRDRRDLKPRIKEVLERGGAYILFCAQDMTPDKKAAILEALRQAANRHLPGCNPIVATISGEAIAAWANQDLWARSFLIRASGREHPALLSTFEEWKEQPGFDNTYIWSDGAREIAQKLLTQIRPSGSVFRLDGAPGLGKTRLVLEALRSVNETGWSVVYYNAGYPGTAADILRAFATWKRQRVGGVVVVDDCDLELHQQIAHLIAGSEMSAVTIDYRRESGANATLRAMKNDVIERIVAEHQTRSSPADRWRIVEYAQGWPLMAILVLRAMADGKEHVADLDDDQLTRRLLGGVDSDAERVLRLVALFDHVGCSDEVETEWETLRIGFIADISREKFFSSVQLFIRKGLIVRIGRYWRVTPPPLAIRLSREWFDDALPDSQDRLFRDISPALIESLARRFSEISTPTAMDLADRLLRSGGRFGSFDGVVGRTNSAMVRALAEVNPASAVATLRRTLGSLNDNELVKIDGRNGRQTFVFALEYIAFHRDCFKDAARVLLALARNENATNANNSSGTLIKLFGASGSQTEAPPELRLQILDEMLDRRDDESQKLVAAALRRALSFEPSHVVLGPESQGGRQPLVEWRPTTWGELFDYYREAVDRVLILSKRNSAGLTLARDIVADAIPTLARYKRWDDLERAVRELRNGAWPKAVELLTWTLRHQLEDAEQTVRARAQSLLGLLMTGNVEERTKLFVSDPPHDLENRNGAIVDVRLERVRQFAAETLASHDVFRVLQILSSDSHTLAYDYGEAIAQESEDLEELSDDALRAFATATEPRNYLALMGIVRSISKRKPSLRLSILERIASDDRLIAALPAVSTQPHVEPDDARRLIAAYESGRLAQEPHPFVFSGKSCANLDDELVRRLATILIDRGWYNSAVDLLTFGVDTTSKFDDLLARTVLEGKFIFKPMLGIHEWSLFEIAIRIVGGGDADFAVAVANDMMDLALSDAGFNMKRRPAELWPVLLADANVWKAYVKRYHAFGSHDRWKLLVGTLYIPKAATEHRLALEVVQIDELLTFAEEFPDDVPWTLAQYGRLIMVRENDSLEIAPLMAALLERFGHRDDVLGNINANLHSFLSVGSRAPYYDKRLELLETIPTYGNAKVAAWKEGLRDGLDAQRRRAQAHDEEFRGGIF